MNTSLRSTAGTTCGTRRSARLWPSHLAASITNTFAINSTPTGALVYRAGETIPLGKTPFTATLLQSNKKTHLRFELDGYESHPTDVKVDESHEVTVRLAKRAPDATPVPTRTPPTPTLPPSPKKPSREGTLDPFATTR